MNVWIAPASIGMATVIGTTDGGDIRKYFCIIKLSAIAMANGAQRQLAM
jgi:hypothetical protein